MSNKNTDKCELILLVSISITVALFIYHSLVTSKVNKAEFGSSGHVAEIQKILSEHNTKEIKEAKEKLTANAIALEVANILITHNGVYKPSIDSFSCYELKGYESVLSCYRKKLSWAKQLNDKFGKFSTPRSFCGKEVQSGYLSFTKDTLEHLTKKVKCFKDHKKELQQKLSIHTDGSGSVMYDEICQDKSLSLAPGWSAIGSVNCTKDIFVCGHSKNVCWINKVQSRLGLGGDTKSSSPLKVKKTGARIVNNYGSAEIR